MKPKLLCMNGFHYFCLAKQLNDCYRKELLEYPARFRGSFGSLSLISLKCDKPQIGISNAQGKVERRDFNIQDLLRTLGEKKKPARPTPEKELQSWLLRNELRTGSFPFDENICLLTDEYACKTANGEKLVADILGFNAKSKSLVLIELKSRRELKELSRQLTATEAGVKRDIQFYKDFLTHYAIDWQEPFAIEKIVVWPYGPGGKKFGGDVREFCYEKQDCNSFSLEER